MSKTLNAVCIIDDDEIYQFTTKRMIEKTQLVKKILVFSDAEKALEFIDSTISNSEDTPEIILLDINMPMMDGWEFLEKYIQIQPKLAKKIIIYMISSSLDKRDIAKAKEISEITDYIVKPISTEQIKEILIR